MTQPIRELYRSANGDRWSLIRDDGKVQVVSSACIRSAAMTCVPIASTSGRISRAVCPTGHRTHDLGLVMCGQRETSVVAMTGPNGGPVQSERVVVSKDPMEAARTYQRVMSGDG